MSFLAKGFSSKMEVVPVTTDPARVEYVPRSEILEFETQKSCPGCGTQEKRRPVVLMGGEKASEAVQLVCCQDCGHVAYDRLPSQKWFDLYYLKEWDKYGRTTRPEDSLQAIPESEWKYFQELGLPKNAKILDFGCGFGTGIKGLMNLGYSELYGVEPSEHRAGFCQKRGLGKVRLGSVDEAVAMAQEIGGFDLIISRHVFEHIRDPHGVLQGLVPALSKKGYFMMITPNVYAETPVDTAMFLPHLNLFNPISMTQMFERVGLKPFVYTPSLKQELITVGSPDSSWTAPSRDYVSEPARIESKALEQLIGFLQAPWKDIERGGDSSFISYIHSYKSVPYPGYREVKGLPLTIVRFADQATKFWPMMQRLRMMHRTYKLVRKIFGKDAVISHKIIGCKVLEKGKSDGLPWISTRNGEAQFLFK